MGTNISILELLDIWILSWPFFRAIFSSNDPPTPLTESPSMVDIIQPIANNQQEPKEAVISQIQFKIKANPPSTTTRRQAKPQLEINNPVEEDRKAHLNSIHALQEVVPTPISRQKVNGLIAEAAELQAKGDLQRAGTRYKACIAWLAIRTNIQNREDVLYSLNSSMALIASRMNTAEIQDYLTVTQDIYKAFPLIYAQEYITLLCNIANNLQSTNQLPQAKNYYQQAHHLAKKYFTYADERFYFILNNLITISLKSGDHTTADQLYKEAHSQLDNQQSQALKEMLELINSNYRQGLNGMAGTEALTLRDQAKGKCIIGARNN